MPFLNLTNHPTSRWQPEQLKAAKRYGQVIDLPFPTINPMDSSQEIKAQAQKLCFQILELQEIHEEPITVHVMGEMTFTFALVRLLKEEGIPVVASTTERLVTKHDDGTRTVAFKFHQFRSY